MTNFLKLNDSKTEFIVFRVKQQLGKVDNIEIKIGKDIIQNVPSVRNLECTSTLNLNTQHITISLPVLQIIHYTTLVE